MGWPDRPGNPYPQGAHGRGAAKSPSARIASAWSPRRWSAGDNSAPGEVKVWGCADWRGNSSASRTKAPSTTSPSAPDGKAPGRRRRQFDDATHQTFGMPRPAQVLFIFQGHTSRISALAFSPDSKRLASASGDRTVRIWDLQNRPGNPNLCAGTHISPRRPGSSARTASAWPSFEDKGWWTFWDWDTQKKNPETLTLKGIPRTRFPQYFGATPFAFSPDLRPSGPASLTRR